METSLRRRTLGNLGITAGTRGVALLMQLGANIVLARSLSEVDFGIVGFAQIFISLLTMLSEFGLSSAAIQKEKLSDLELYTGWTLRLILGFVGFGIALIIAPLCANLLNEPAVSEVLMLLAVGFTINALAFIPSVRILRELNYRKFSLAQLGGAAVNATVTISLALNGFTYWSIVIANIASTLVAVAILNVLAGTRPQLTIDRGSAIHYRNFGGSILISWVLTFLVINLDSLFIGSMVGAATLGYFALAFTWGTKIAENLGSVINSVMFPTFSKIQNERERLRSAYLKGLELTAFLTLGGYATLFIMSEMFIIEVLGKGTDKWLPALMTLKIMCAYGAVRAMTEPVGSVIMALGGPGLLVRANLLAAVIKVLLIYPAFTRYGIEGVAALAVLSYSSQFAIFLPALGRRLEISSLDLLKVVLPSGLSAISVIALLPPLISFVDIETGILRFIVCSLIGGAIFVIAFGIVSRGQRYRELWESIIPSTSR